MKGLGVPLLLLTLFVGHSDNLVLGDHIRHECGSNGGHEDYCPEPECCGISGSCGTSAAECAPGNCQIGYGRCWDHAPPPPPHPSPPPPHPSPPPPKPSPPPPMPSPPPPTPSPPPPTPSPPPPKPSPPPPTPSPPPPKPSPPPPTPSPPPPYPEYCGRHHGDHVCQDQLACCGTGGTCGYSFYECSVGHCQPGFGECYDWPEPELCGPENHGSSCKNASNPCCSVYGECGNHYLQCSERFCEPDFGTCTNPPIPDPPQNCGPDYDHSMCPTGKCCSVYGECGFDHFHCSSEYCQHEYGSCYASPTKEGRFLAARKTAFFNN